MNKIRIVEVRKPDGTMDGIDIMGFHHVGRYKIVLNYTDLFFAGHVTLSPWQAFVTVENGRVVLSDGARFEVPKKVLKEVQKLAERMMDKVESMKEENLSVSG